jgi:acyl-CoA thioesterase I
MNCSPAAAPRSPAARSDARCRSRRAALATLALALTPLVAACHRTPPNLDSPGHNLVCLGDSIAAGVGASPGHGFVDVLAEGLGVEVRNAGVAGDTAAAGLARLPAVLAADPWLVVVELGGNDILRQVPIEDTEQALGEIVRQLLAARVLPVLVAVGGPFGSRHADLYDRLGSRYRVPVVRQVLREILLDPALKADEVHPNDLGHARLAAAIAETIKPWIDERRRRFGR